MSHFLLMVVYAAIVGLFLAVLWKTTARDRVKLFLQIFFGMVGGALLLGWLMLPFPSGPPAPIP